MKSAATGCVPLRARGKRVGSVHYSIPEAVMGDALSAVRQYFDCINRDDADGAARCLADDYLYHGAASFGAERQTKDEYVAMMKDLTAAWTDFHAEAVDEEVCGDWVFVTSIFTAKFTGATMGVQGTGQDLEVAGITGLRVKDGKVVEEWEQLDSLGLAQQMGLVPALA